MVSLNKIVHTQVIYVWTCRSIYYISIYQSEYLYSFTHIYKHIISPDIWNIHYQFWQHTFKIPSRILGNLWSKMKFPTMPIAVMSTIGFRRTSRTIYMTIWQPFSFRRAELPSSPSWLLLWRFPIFDERRGYNELNLLWSF